jgi:hypothetical protein
MVDQQAVESKLGFVSHLKNLLSIASRGARRPETFPKTATYSHFGAAKPLSPFQPLHALLALRGRAGQPGPLAENRERGPIGASVGCCYRVQFVYSDAPNEAICPKSIGVGTCDRIAPALD